MSKWEELKASPSVRKKLAAAWGVSVPVASAWYRSAVEGWKKDLTQDGDMHPHPGPSLRTIAFNCGGLSGCWRAVKEFLPSNSTDVLFLQEICVSASEVQSLRRFVFKHGFRLFHAPGSIVPVVGAAPRQRGGVALLVPKCFRVRPAWSWSGDDSQFIGAWVDGWLLASVYACPGHNEAPVFDLLEALVPWMAQIPLTQPWLISGDFNELVSTSKLYEGLAAFGGCPVSVDQPTRWEGDRCIDWALTNRPQVCSLSSLVDIHLSDHIPVSLKVDGLGHALKLGSLRRTSSLLCPVDVDRALRERALLNQWNESAEVFVFMSFLQQNEFINVQEEWDRFQSLLVTCILSSYTWLAGVCLLPPEVRADCERLACQCTFKGQSAVYRQSSCAHAGVRRSVGYLATRKKRRLLARCFQYKRLLLRQVSDHLTAVQHQELLGLKVQLSKRFGEALTLRHMVAHITDIQRELCNSESSERNQSIASWRHRMVSSDAELSRWLKNRSADCAASVVDRFGRITESDVEAAAAVADFWDDFWQRARARQPSFSDRVASLLAGLPRFQAC